MKKANDIIIKAGRHAGRQFCENMLDRDLDFGKFVSQLQDVLKNQAIGILRIEKADLEGLMFTLSIAEDLDCSGLPPTDEVICQYDEGFITGIMEAYTGKPFQARVIVDERERNLANLLNQLIIFMQEVHFFIIPLSKGELVEIKISQKFFPVLPSKNCILAYFL